MKFGNVAKDIDTFMETFAEGIEMRDMIDMMNQVVEYSKGQPYSKEGEAGLILNAWMAGFMNGYSRGKQDASEVSK